MCTQAVKLAYLFLLDFFCPSLILINQNQIFKSLIGMSGRHCSRLPLSPHPMHLSATPSHGTQLFPKPMAQAFTNQAEIVLSTFPLSTVILRQRSTPDGGHGVHNQCRYYH